MNQLIKQAMIKVPGEIVATDNGDTANFTPFPSHERKTFDGLALVIIRSIPGDFGSITITAKSTGLQETIVVNKSK